MKDVYAVFAIGFLATAWLYPHELAERISIIVKAFAP